MNGARIEKEYTEREYNSTGNHWLSAKAYRFAKHREEHSELARGKRIRCKVGHKVVVNLVFGKRRNYTDNHWCKVELPGEVLPLVFVYVVRAVEYKATDYLLINIKNENYDRADHCNASRIQNKLMFPEEAKHDCRNDGQAEANQVECAVGHGILHAKALPSCI